GAARVLPAVLHGRSRGLAPGGGPYPVPGEGRAALPAAVGAMADAAAHGLATRGHPHLAAKITCPGKASCASRGSWRPAQSATSGRRSPPARPAEAMATAGRRAGLAESARHTPPPGNDTAPSLWTGPARGWRPRHDSNVRPSP